MPVDAPPQVSRRHSTDQFDNELISSVDEIVKNCPKFRILVIGKSGAGKSSLINAAFNVKLAHVSHSRAGVSNIHEEITSEQNPRFILHDSQGFAAGETHNFEVVENFIRSRAMEDDLRNRLHAIWFCIEVPTENSALFEIGDQRFLNLDLGDIPVIVVFTKYDLLVAKFEKEAVLEMDGAFDDETDDEFDRRIRKQAEEAYHKTCVEPLQRVCAQRSKPIPYMKVSTTHGFERTLTQLVHITQEHIDRAVWLIWAFAQRSNADLKVAASIEVGKRKYWRGLASSLNFPGKTLKKCLGAIHKDIVTVWNFYDPGSLLESQEFQALMSHLVSDLMEESGDAHRRMMISVAGAAGVISAAVPPAAPAALPIAVGIVFAQWVWIIYRDTPGVLRALMAYIVDLTIVMQSLFWLAQSRNGGDGQSSKALPLDPRLIKLAIRAYRESGDRTTVHQEIVTYVDSINAFTAAYHRDQVLEKIVQLIEQNRFVPPEQYKEDARHWRPVLDDGFERLVWVEEPDEIETPVDTRQTSTRSAAPAPERYRPPPSYSTALLESAIVR